MPIGFNLIYIFEIRGERQVKPFTVNTVNIVNQLH